MFKYIIGLCILIVGASAKLYITLPDAESKWRTGYVGVVEWNSSATEFGLLCDIQLIDTSTQEIALNLTNNSIPCSLNTFNTSRLAQFEHETFLVRIGNSSIWSYTQDFRIFH